MGLRGSLQRRLLTLGSLVAVAILFALLVFRLLDSSRGPQLVAAIQAGSKPAAPAFDLAVIWPHSETWPASLRSVAGQKTIHLRDLRGFPTVVNFWASWCTACGTEAARLAQAARRKQGDVVFVGVDVNDFASDARRFLGRHHANYVSVRARGGSIYDAYGLIGLPETYYLDRRGRVVAQTVGEVTEQKLEAGIVRAERG